MRPAGSSRDRSWIGPAAKPNSASAWTRREQVMPLRDALALVFVAAVMATSGCGGKSYVRTSLGKEHHIEPAVNRISEEGKGRRDRDGEAGVQRDLAEIAQYLTAGDFDAVKRQAKGLLKRQPNSIDALTYLALALDKT